MREQDKEVFVSRLGVLIAEIEKDKFEDSCSY